MRGAIKRYHQRRVSGSLSGHQPLWGDRTSALTSPLVRNQSRNQSSSREIAPRPCRAPWYAISHAIKAHQGRSHLGLVEPLDARGEHANERPDGAPPACNQWQASVAIISGTQWQHASIAARRRLTWRAPLDWTCELARGSRSREMPSCASACRAR